MPLKTLIIFSILLLTFSLEARSEQSLRVTASSYTSHKNQCQGNPTIGAWGDRLKPEIKSIAVSQDLLGKGLHRGKKVKIVGLKGTYIVKDKMHSKWRNKIDIYMGYDRGRAIRWGRRSVTIRWK